jgi:hypothetical protein
MDESDPTFLLKQADKCRRLALAVTSPGDAEKLEELALEYEAEARKIEFQLGRTAPSAFPKRKK